eukprot:TRINITY_DN5507_c0_g3_i1.p1 TRINITY_DN5507_c0_g3~~TRINITY_DN5507_c0_g3_i1.p1  ORF type:complete len:130 (+),score=22.15 TRINITY_DN5507_c0_g3_i1:34-390(+)
MWEAVVSTQSTGGVPYGKSPYTMPLESFRLPETHQALNPSHTPLTNLDDFRLMVITSCYNTTISQWLFSFERSRDLSAWLIWTPLAVSQWLFSFERSRDLRYTFRSLLKKSRTLWDAL